MNRRSFVVSALIFTVMACKTSSLTHAEAQTLPAEVILKVTPEEIEIISSGLQTQPFGKVAPLMQKLRDQVVAQQIKPVDNPAKPADPETKK